MGTHISPSIIMRAKEFGESDLLVSFFTSDRGRLDGVAKGARRSQKRFVNCLEIFCLANMEYEVRTHGRLAFLHSCKLLEGFPGLRGNFSSLSLASYMVELTGVLFPPNVADQRMFKLLRESLRALDKGKRPDVLRILFEARAMTLGGYAVNLDKCCVCGRTYAGAGRAVFNRDKGGIACMKCQRESPSSPGLDPSSVRAFKAVQELSWEKVSELELGDDTITEMKQTLTFHIEYRLGQRLKTAKFLI